MYTQIALQAAAAGDWPFVYKLLHTGKVDLNAINATDTRGQFTLLDYAMMQNQIYLVHDLQIRTASNQSPPQNPILSPKPYRPNEEPELYRNFIQYFELLSLAPNTKTNPPIDATNRNIVLKKRHPNSARKNRKIVHK